MKLKFKALQEPKEGALYEHNHFGWKVIETLVFNYDGKGGVLVLLDGELDTLTEGDFKDLLYGGWYQLVKGDPQLEFVDAQIIKEQHPTTFDAPTPEELQNLKVGDVVKVCAFKERFWTIIQKIEGNLIVARVAHGLYTHELEVNDEVHFHKNNIYQIANESKEDLLKRFNEESLQPR